eukprot:6277090-Prymnesium_polylepis.1
MCVSSAFSLGFSLGLAPLGLSLFFHPPPHIPRAVSSRFGVAPRPPRSHPTSRRQKGLSHVASPAWVWTV